MENLKKLTLAEVKGMTLSELQAINQTGLNAPVKQAIAVRMIHLQTPALDEIAPVETLQEQIAQDSITTDAPEVKAPEVTAPVVVTKAKNKPFETTRDIVAFADDTKGIRALDMVTFTEHKGGTGKVLTGQVMRLFDFYAKPERQEAKIMVTAADGKTKTRFYRFEKDITKVVPAPAEQANVEGEGI